MTHFPTLPKHFRKTFPFKKIKKIPTLFKLLYLKIKFEHLSSIAVKTLNFYTTLFMIYRLLYLLYIIKCSLIRKCITQLRIQVKCKKLSKIKMYSKLPIYILCYFNILLSAQFRQLSIAKIAFVYLPINIFINIFHR